MKCLKCYPLCDPIPNCLDTLQIMTKQDSQELKVVIKDKFDHHYAQMVTSEANGLVTLPTTEYPAQLLNENAGEFMLSIYKDNEIVPFVVSGIDYDCLKFHVEQFSPEQSSYLIDVYNTANSPYY